MKQVIVAGALVFALLAGANAADARGCLKGAVAGGVAGHFAGHHALLGAAAGCAIGHHLAHRHDQAIDGTPRHHLFHHN